MRITLLGDIMVKPEQLSSYEKDGKYDFTEALQHIKSAFSDSDYIVANLETPVAGEALGYTNEPYCFNTPSEIVQNLKQCGVNMVTTANNHCLDRGIEGIRNTIDNLEKCGLDYVGTHKQRENSFIIKEIEGIRVAFLAFSYGTNAFANNEYLNTSQKYMVDLLQRQELTNLVTRKLWQSNHMIIRAVRKLLRIVGMGQLNVPVYERRESSKREIAYYKQQIEKCKKLGAEYIVACLHIGGQYNDLPTEYTKEICQLSLELGVNAVIANHEHVIHGIDMRHLSKRTFCIYSLGNFLSASGVVSEPFDKMAEYSIAINLDLTKDEDKKILAEYSFEIFCNVLNADNKVISVPLFDYINSGLKEEVQRKLLAENNVLVNRIFNTVGVEYPLLREYRVSVERGY